MVEPSCSRPTAGLVRHRIAEDTTRSAELGPLVANCPVNLPSAVLRCPVDGAVLEVAGPSASVRQCHLVAACTLVDRLADPGELAPLVVDRRHPVPPLEILLP